MTDALYGLIVAILIILAWIGGGHTEMRKNRLLVEAQAMLVTDNRKLRLEIEELKALVYSLQAYIEDYRREVARLSADLAAWSSTSNEEGG